MIRQRIMPSHLLSEVTTEGGIEMRLLLLLLLLNKHLMSHEPSLTSDMSAVPKFRKKVTEITFKGHSISSEI